MNNICTHPERYGFVVNIRETAEAVEATPIGIAFHVNAVATNPGLRFYRYLASIFDVRVDAFTYGEFAQTMMMMGWLHDSEEGILLPPVGLAMAEPLPFNLAGLPLTTLVDRAAQNGWCEYMREHYGWKVFSTRREEDVNRQVQLPPFIVYVLNPLV